MLTYGATFELTPKEGGMKAAIARAQEIVDTQGAWMPQQFDNPAHVAVHAATPAREILADFSSNPIDVLITGLGTGGPITACGEGLKKEWPDLKVFAVDAQLSAVLSGGPPGTTPIHGPAAGSPPT